jgi:hypothetical protein
MERRKTETKHGASPLPSDYLKMVSEVFTTNFDDALKALEKLTQNEPSFEASGAVYPNEAVLSVTLIVGEQLSSTTVHASSDYDPKASAPTIQDILGVLVDGIAGVFQPLLDPENHDTLASLVSSSASALENVPFEWSKLEVEHRKIYVKIDKSNPKLENLADEWLKKNDPLVSQEIEEEEKETENLFVTGPKTKH